MALQIYTAYQAAELLGCSAKTVEGRLRTGDLPGLKFGDGWVIPAGAFWRRLDELALEQAAARRKPGGGCQPAAVAGAAEPAGKPARGRAARTLPRLVSMDGAGA